MDRDRDEEGTAGLALAREVGLVLRAHRRELGKSQRAYAATRRVSRGMLARAEVDASSLTLGAAASLPEGSAFTLAVVPADAERPPVDWEPTDLVARTRREPVPREQAGAAERERTPVVVVPRGAGVQGRVRPDLPAVGGGGVQPFPGHRLRAPPLASAR
jgi:hypothetical protein